MSKKAQFEYDIYFSVTSDASLCGGNFLQSISQGMIAIKGIVTQYSVIEAELPVWSEERDHFSNIIHVVQEWITLDPIEEVRSLHEVFDELEAIDVAKEWTCLVMHLSLI